MHVNLQRFFGGDVFNCVKSLWCLGRAPGTMACGVPSNARPSNAPKPHGTAIMLARRLDARMGGTMEISMHVILMNQSSNMKCFMVAIIRTSSCMSL